MSKTLPLWLIMIALVSTERCWAEDVSNTVNLSIRPIECVVLHEGDLCHAKLNVTWQANKEAEYCLHKKPDSRPLQCWKANSGRHQQSIATADDILFILKIKETGLIVAETKLSVAWVHEKTSRPIQTWRLF